MWGAAVLERPEATYVYGVGFGDGHALRVARTAGPGLDGRWQFASPDGWSVDPTSAAVRANGLCTQLSVVPVDGAYGLVSQAPDLGADVPLRLAERPDGPWSEPPALLAGAPPPRPGTFTYNAVLHLENAGAQSMLSPRTSTQRRATT